MTSWMMLCHIVGSIEAAFAPLDVELALSNTIADPEETHVHGF